MTNSLILYTLTKIAKNYKSLEEVINLYKKDFVPLEGGIAEKFVLYNPSPHKYLITIFQYNGLDLQKWYNVLLTITSDFPGLNKEIAKEIAEKSRIGFYDAPPNLSKLMSHFNLVFPIFNDYGSQQAMEMLKSMARKELL